MEIARSDITLEPWPVCALSVLTRFRDKTFQGCIPFRTRPCLSVLFECDIIDSSFFLQNLIHYSFFSAVLKLLTVIALNRVKSKYPKHHSHRKFTKTFHKSQKMAVNVGLAIGLSMGLGIPPTVALIILAVTYGRRR